MSLHQHDPPGYDFGLKEITPPKLVPLRNTRIRWFALFLTCLINFGNYYCVDNPQALQSSLQATLHIDTYTFGDFYFYESIPNVIVPLFGGLITDFLGVRVSIIIFSLLVILGQLLFTYGGYLLNFNLMILGRFIFGIGSETLTSSQTVITSKWFVGKELAFSFGVTLCVARLGSASNSVMSPLIYEWSDNKIYFPLFVGLVLCIVSFLCALPLCALDKKADDIEGEYAVKEITEKFSCRDLKSFTLIFYLMLFNCFFVYGGFFGFTDNVNDLIRRDLGFPRAAQENISLLYI